MRGSIVRDLSTNEDLKEIARILGEIPDPAFGYLRWGLLEHRKMDYVLTNDLVQRALNKLVYVEKVGMNDIDVSFMCEKISLVGII